MNKAFSLMNKLTKKEHIFNPAQDIVQIKLNAAVYNLHLISRVWSQTFPYQEPYSKTFLLVKQKSALRHFKYILKKNLKGSFDAFLIKQVLINSTSFLFIN